MVLVRTRIRGSAFDRLVRFCLGLKGAWIRSRGGCGECDVNALHVAERGTVGKAEEQRMEFLYRKRGEGRRQRSRGQSVGSVFFIRLFPADLLLV